MITKYLKLTVALINISSKRYLENRLNTFGTIFGSLISFLINILFINIVFSYTKSFNGWDKSGVLIIYACAKIVTSLFITFFHRGVGFLSEYVRLGNLDLLLMKPISSQFYVSLRLTKPFELSGCLFGLYLFYYVYVTSNLKYNIVDFAALIISLICGLLIFYSIYYLVATLSIWFVNFYSLSSVYHVLSAPLSFPTNIYGSSVSFLISYVVPLTFIVTTPVEIFLQHNYFLIIIEVIVSVILLLLTALFWNYALKRYSSASS